MAEGLLFLAFSISQAWDWLVQIPYLGIFFLFLLVVVVGVVVIFVFVFLKSMDRF